MANFMDVKTIVFQDADIQGISDETTKTRGNTSVLMSLT